MKLAQPRCLALVAALALGVLPARPAAADTPPSDLPPLPPGAAPGGAARAPVRQPDAAPVAPGKPVVPPVTPMPTGYFPPSGYGAPPGYGAPGYGAPGYGAPPGYQSPGEVPPGYSMPRYALPYPIVQSDPYALPPLPPRRRYDNGLFAGGVVAVLGGMTMALTGAYLVSSAAQRIEIYCDMPSVPCAHKTDAPRMTGGALLMAAGALVGAAGIPMWFAGSRWVAAPKDEKKDEKKPALRPEVRIGVGSAGVRLRF